MSYVNVILTAMKPNREYRYCDLEAETRLPRAEVRRICESLVKGGMIEQTGEEKVKRRKERKFRTKQLPLAIP